MKNILMVIKGAGDLASGIAHRLYICGCVPVMTELPQPLAVRRTVAFAQAVYARRAEIEGVKAMLAENVEAVNSLRRKGIIPVIIDPRGKIIPALSPAVVVDAVMAKRNTGTELSDAPVVIGVGPGFFAGRDVHAVVETRQGHNLGRVIRSGEAEPDTKEPAPVEGYTHQRVLRSPGEGVFRACRDIGERVAAEDIVGYVDCQPVQAQISGVLRGLLNDHVKVTKGLKIGDVDPRAVVAYCYSISEKARAVAGGVLEAILHFRNRSG